MVIQEHFSDTLDTLGQEHLIWRSYDKMSLMNFLYGVNHLLPSSGPMFANEMAAFNFLLDTLRFVLPSTIRSDLAMNRLDGRTK